jgi:hypothetical protein
VLARRRVRIPGVSAASCPARRAAGLVTGGIARAVLPPLGRVAGRGAPDRAVALDRYRGLAEPYDRRTISGDPYRKQTVERLAPQPGEVVVDVGRGTGLNFELIEDGVGPNGPLIGIDLSPEMLVLARALVHSRAARSGRRPGSPAASPSTSPPGVRTATA